MSHQTRRTFLKRSAATTGFGVFAIAGTKASGRVLGANDMIRVAVAGINGRGRAHMGEFAGRDGCQVTYLVDPDTRLFQSRAAVVEAKGGNRPKCVPDIREVLDDKNLDVVSVATTNHWHALTTVWACQAGKDVYVEKPCSHNVFEGRQAVRAARKYGRIVQHGTQRRSSSDTARLVAAVRSGHYGKLLISHAYHYGRRGSIGFRPASEPPAEIDFNLWLGPAPKQPFHANLVHYNWHWFWDFGNGEIGNNGVHHMDVIRWAMNDTPLPGTVFSLGGRFGYEDQAQTPNTHLVIYDFGGVKHIFECRGLQTPRRPSPVFYLEEGKIVDGKFYPKGKGEDKAEPLVEVDYDVQTGGPFGNFIDCVRSRKREQLNADILQGHLSSSLCHLGNISHRMGEEVPFNKKSKTLGEDKDAYEAFEETKEHLADDNDLKLEEMTYRLGAKLEFDPNTEKFIDCPEADALLTRDYRAPFVVPEQV